MKQLKILLALLVLSLPAVRSLLLPGAYTSHDLTHHVVRQISMDRNLKEGQFPPRWSGELNNGYGYPVFLFNYPLPAMLGEIFHLAGLNFVSSVKAVLFVGLIGSALGMYLFLKSFLKSDLSSLLGSIFYLYAPIRFVNTYVSAAVGSSLAMAIVPFVFWSLVQIKNGKSWAVLAGALSLSLLVIAHNVTALMFAPAILIFALLFVREIRKIGMMFLLGAGLSAWFWLPAVFEKQFILYDELVKRFYQDQFPTMQQLFYSPWGFGLSHPENPTGGISYQVGLAHWLVAAVALILSFIYWKKKEFRVVSLFSLSLFAVSIFLMLKVSLFFWDNLPGLNLIQYPFRLLAVSVFTASILAGLLIRYLPYKQAIFAILLVLVLYANRNHLGINQSFDPGEQYYLNQKPTTAAFNEHLPKWGSTPAKAASGKLQFLSGIGTIEYKKDTSAQMIASLESSSSAKLRFNQFYFPGWEISINGQKVAFDYLQKGENYGLPVFKIAPGKSVFVAQFTNTWDRKIADAIGIFSAIVWIILLVYCLPKIISSKAV